VALLGPGAALAQSCSFGFTDVDFGNVDVTTGGSYDTTGTFSASCTGTAGATIRICPHVGAGSGGAGGNGSPRTMLKGGDSLNYNLYKDASRTAVWGSYLAGWSATPPQVDLTLNGSGSGSVNTTVYGRVTGAQNTAAVGAYSSTFSSADVKVRWAYASADDCSTIGSGLEATPTFTARATVQAQCTVSATDLNFGSAGIISAARDATNTVSVVCTRDAAYTVALNGGVSGASDPTQRKMTKASEFILYGLYRDGARTLPWGDTQGINTAAGTGSGSTQNHTVYGRVPAQATPSPGTYTDTIVVTVTY
jgi:spore coat protein U-like protein